MKINISIIIIFTIINLFLIGVTQYFLINLKNPVVVEREIIGEIVCKETIIIEKDKNYQKLFDECTMEKFLLGNEIDSLK
jgi:alkyl sulfatase BDS1-like metallo-beta-lactamase superfamily hydrolase|tara:strand:+ start:2915 stop:3154 length:240 start_codon:yes stop_codon:yes gene_type:complete